VKVGGEEAGASDEARARNARSCGAASQRARQARHLHGSEDFEERRLQDRRPAAENFAHAIPTRASVPVDDANDGSRSHSLIIETKRFRHGSCAECRTRVLAVAKPPPARIVGMLNRCAHWLAELEP